MSGSSSPSIVQLTPPGRGAIATLLVEGPGAVEVVERRFLPHGGRPLKSLSNDRLALGHFGSKCGEEIVVRCRSPRAVEIHCHGGRAAAAMIERSLIGLGCRSIAWREWVREQHDDPITAAAHAALADARTERTAAILLDQYQGALRRAFDRIEAALRNADHQSAAVQIDALLARAKLGQHLTRPWRVVLAGKPNVGKSSLINALVGYRRAIVHHTPGTTRDVVTAAAAIDGWPVELSDTAGLHGAGNVTERTGIELARQKLASADLVVLVFDVSTTWSGADRALPAAWPDGLVVHNKIDLPPAAGPRREGLCVSVLTGQGIDDLVAAIADRLAPDPPAPGSAVPFTAEQIHHLDTLRDGIR